MRARTSTGGEGGASAAGGRRECRIGARMKVARRGSGVERKRSETPCEKDWSCERGGGGGQPVRERREPPPREKAGTHLPTVLVAHDAHVHAVEPLPALARRSLDLAREEDHAGARPPQAALALARLGAPHKVLERLVQARLADQERDGGRLAAGHDERSAAREVLRGADGDDGDALARGGGARLESGDVLGERALEGAVAGVEEGQLEASRAELRGGGGRTGAQDADGGGRLCGGHARRVELPRRCRQGCMAVAEPCGGQDQSRRSGAATSEAMAELSEISSVCRRPDSGSPSRSCSWLSTLHSHPTPHSYHVPLGHHRYQRQRCRFDQRQRHRLVVPPDFRCQGASPSLRHFLVR